MTPLAVVFRAQALNDLAEISHFFSKSDPAAASRVIQRIHATIFKTLAQFPMVGRLDPETGAREFPVPNLPYIVVFLPLDEVLDVADIFFHTSRDPTTKLRP